MRAYRLHLGEEALVHRLAYNGDVVAFKMGRRRDPAWHISTRFRNVWHGRDALLRDPAWHVSKLVFGFSHGRSRVYSGYGISSRLWTWHAGSRGSASLPWG
jgi:hypothetical protein